MMVREAIIIMSALIVTAQLNPVGAQPLILMPDPDRRPVCDQECMRKMQANKDQLVIAKMRLESACRRLKAVTAAGSRSGALKRMNSEAWELHWRNVDECIKSGYWAGSNEDPWPSVH